eukprot:7394040-Pyramimonas_sp.AAC.1
MWTATPLPLLSDGWESFGLDRAVGPGCTTPNPDGSEMIIFGDSSGGADTADPRLRRVALGVCILEMFDPPRVASFVTGGLAGLRQSVSRGELKAFWLALWCCSAPLRYVTDCEPVFLGWMSRKYRSPSGADADIWA